MLKSIILNFILLYVLCSLLFVILFIEGYSIFENDVGICVSYELYIEIVFEMILLNEGIFVLLNLIIILL